jgi:hypothetical protein
MKLFFRKNAFSLGTFLEVPSVPSGMFREKSITHEYIEGNQHFDTISKNQNNGQHRV